MNRIWVSMVGIIAAAAVHSVALATGPVAQGAIQASGCPGSSSCATEKAPHADASAGAYVATDGDKTVHGLLKRWSLVAGTDLMWLPSVDFPILNPEHLNESAQLDRANSLIEATGRVLKLVTEEAGFTLSACQKTTDRGLMPLLVYGASENCDYAKAEEERENALVDKLVREARELIDQVQSDLKKMDKSSRSTEI